MRVEVTLLIFIREPYFFFSPIENIFKKIFDELRPFDARCYVSGNIIIIRQTTILKHSHHRVVVQRNRMIHKQLTYTSLISTSVGR